MSAHALLAEALSAALKEHAPFAGSVTAVFDAPPSRAVRPYAVIEEPLLSDWGTKDMAGREGRVAVRLHDSGPSAARLRRLAGAVETGIEALPRVIGEGWQVVSLVFVRSRIAREGEGRWMAVSEWRVRMLRTQ